MKTDTPSKPQAAEAPARRRDPRGSRSDLPPDFEAWFREYRESVYRYVRFRVATRESAEDITSEVFLKALRSLEGYDRRRAAPRTWLLRIARNAVTDHLRSLRRRRSLQVSLDRVPDLVSQAPSQEERILREEQVSRLLNAAATLRAADQEVLSLRYGAGLGNGEIADAMGTSNNVVAVRVHRALVRLKAAVEARSQREER